MKRFCALFFAIVCLVLILVACDDPFEEAPQAATAATSTSAIIIQRAFLLFF